MDTNDTNDVSIQPFGDVFEIPGNIGELENIGESKLHREWLLYEEGMERYFEANMVDVERRVAVLLTAIGEDFYTILRDVCSPETPASRTYKELIEIMHDQFAPRPSIYKSRDKFFSLYQLDNESISNWFFIIKNTAIPCKFGNMLYDSLKHKFVCGLKPGSIQDCILKGDFTNFSLNEVLDLALKIESSVNQGTDVAAVNKFKMESRDGEVDFNTIDISTSGEGTTSVPEVTVKKSDEVCCNEELNIGQSSRSERLIEKPERD